MTTWAVIVSIGLGTYLLRVSMLLVLAGRSLPERARTAIGLVAPAALSGLVTTMLIGEGAPPDRADIVAVIAGFVAVRRTGHVLHAFVVGLPVFAALTFAL